MKIRTAYLPTLISGSKLNPLMQWRDFRDLSMRHLTHHTGILAGKSPHQAI